MSKRQELREKRARQQTRTNISIGVGLLIVVAVIAFFTVVPSIMEASQPLGSFVTPAPRAARPNASDNTMGDPNAPIKIVEYSDYQCPFCRNFFNQTEHQLEENYIATGKVHFTYRSMGNFVSDNITGGTGANTESKTAAEAAYCAGAQGKYWEYHDILFTNQNGENEGAFSKKRLNAFAEALGLNTTDFSSCLNSNQFASRVQSDFADGRSAGVNGTPSFVISYVVNGETKTKFLEGAQPFNVFQENINAALQEMGLPVP